VPTNKLLTRAREIAEGLAKLPRLFFAALIGVPKECY
jgi:hypothetical protein